jgi:outer membrane protein OmpA-like peptidoglycan-associated protein
MKTRTFSQVALVTSAVALAPHACATAPPTELVEARASFERARNGPAAKVAPVQLRKADLALQTAEQSFQAGKDDRRTRDLAYVADRQALIAEAVAATARAQAEQLATQRQLAKKQAATPEQAKVALAHSQGQLAEAAQRKTQTEATLAMEQAARGGAEKNAREATEALAKLAAKEEARGTVITLSGSVLFATNEAMLLPGARERLDQVADALATKRGRAVTVEGHTDSRGTAQHNLALSQRRAEAVRSHLMSRGSPPDKIEARGMGMERPVKGNESAEGRANNRRVEIVIQRTPTAP